MSVFFLDMLTTPPLGQGLFCENFKDAPSLPPSGSELFITEDLVDFFLTEDGLDNFITE